MCNRKSNQSRNLISKSKSSRLTLLLSVFSLLLAFSPYHTTFADTQLSNTEKTVGITQIVEHPALDAVRLGIIAGLKTAGFEEGRNLKIVFENAQGNIGTASQIALKLLSIQPDVCVGISTPSAQTLYFAAQKQTKKIPIVFTAVSDYQAANLVQAPINAKGAVPLTGVTDAPNLEGLLELMNKLMPNIKTLGLLYTPSEINSVSTINRLKPLLEAQGIKPMEVTVTKTSEVAQAVQSLIGKVDALYFPQDNTVVSAIETISKIADHSSPTLPVILPIFSSDPDLMTKGILAAVGYDYTEVGRDTGAVVARILKGESALNIPITHPSHLKAAVNQRLAEKLNLVIPKTLNLSEIEIVRPK